MYRNEFFRHTGVPGIVHFVPGLRPVHSDAYRLLSKILSECEDADEIEFLAEGSWRPIRAEKEPSCSPQGPILVLGESHTQHPPRSASQAGWLSTVVLSPQAPQTPTGSRQPPAPPAWAVAWVAQAALAAGWGQQVAWRTARRELTWWTSHWTARRPRKMTMRMRTTMRTRTRAPGRSVAARSRRAWYPRADAAAGR